MRKSAHDTREASQGGILAFLAGMAGPLMFFAPPRPDSLFCSIAPTQHMLRRRGNLPYWVRSATATIQRNAAYIQRNGRAQ